MEKRYEFDKADLLSAFAVGVPGHRTFFLALGQQQKWVRAWLEKDQLAALSAAIEQFLFTLGQEQPGILRGVEQVPVSNIRPRTLPAAELDIGEMTLGFDGGKAILDFTARVSGQETEEQIEISCQVALARLKKLGEQAAEVCVAGRPRCILCGNPIEPSGHHVCPAYN